MKRRTFIAALGALAAGHGFAQVKPRRIGLLYFASRESAVRTGRYDAFLDRMRALGYAPGKDFVLEERFSEGQAWNCCVASRPSWCARTSTSSSPSARTPLERRSSATSTIPIVVAQVGGDPVRSGFAQSLARPGGNVTGMYVSNVELLPKQLELLAAVVPKMTRVGGAFEPHQPGASGAVR